MLGLIVLLSACALQPSTHESLTIAAPSLEQNALLYIAADQGFFAANGLDVHVSNVDSGPAALTALANGAAQLANTSEFPVVTAIFKKTPIRILLSSDKFENDYLLARKDLGIVEPTDLKGKRIGLARQTVNEFFLGRFLELHGMSIRDVQLVDLKPAEFVDAFSTRKVDAIVAWEPYIDRIRLRESGLIEWPAQSNRLVYGLLTCRSDWLASHGKTVEAFVRALGQAESWANASSDQARSITQKQLNYGDAYVARIWPQHHFSLSLDFSLIAAMTDEAHWVIDSGLAPDTSVPDFGGYLYTPALKAVKPEAVTVFP